MIIGGDNRVCLRCHGRVDTVVVFQFHQKVVSNGNLCLCIPIIGRLRTIWYKLLVKLRLLFNGLLFRKEIFSESSDHIETHIDTIVEII